MALGKKDAWILSRVRNLAFDLTSQSCPNAIHVTEQAS